MVTFLSDLVYNDDKIGIKNNIIWLSLLFDHIYFYLIIFKINQIKKFKIIIVIFMRNIIKSKLPSSRKKRKKSTWIIWIIYFTTRLKLIATFTNISQSLNPNPNNLDIYINKATTLITSISPFDYLLSKQINFYIVQ